MSENNLRGKDTIKSYKKKDIILGSAKKGPGFEFNNYRYNENEVSLGLEIFRNSTGGEHGVRGIKIINLEIGKKILDLRNDGKTNTEISITLKKDGTVVGEKAVRNFCSFFPKGGDVGSPLQKIFKVPRGSQIVFTDKQLVYYFNNYDSMTQIDIAKTFLSDKSFNAGIPPTDKNVKHIKESLMRFERYTLSREGVIDEINKLISRGELDKLGSDGRKVKYFSNFQKGERLKIINSGT
jgi:hypothetical protein